MFELYHFLMSVDGDNFIPVFLFSDPVFWVFLPLFLKGHLKVMYILGWGREPQKSTITCTSQNLQSPRYRTMLLKTDVKRTV